MVSNLPRPATGEGVVRKRLGGSDMELELSGLGPYGSMVFLLKYVSEVEAEDEKTLVPC